MRVEITFGGDAAEAEAATELVVKALKNLFAQADETGFALKEVKITSSQATDTEVQARRMQSSLQGVQREARQTRRDLDAVRLAGIQGSAANVRSVQTLGLASLVGLGVAGSGPVGGAALGAIAALPAALATGGAAVGVLAGAFQGLGKAVEGNRQAFEALNPETQQFVQTIRSLIPWVKTLQDTARQGLFPGLEEGLHSALTPANAGAISQAASQIASALGNVAKEWGQSLGSPAFTAGFSTVITDGAKNLVVLGDAADHLATALGRVTVAGLPITDWMTREIDVGSRLLDNWTGQAQATGKLASEMQSAQHELDLVAHLVGALADAVLQLSKDLTPLGNNLIVELTAGLQGLAKWLEANRKEIDNVAEGALQALIAALKLADETLVPLGKALYDVTQATIGFKTAFELLIAAFAAFKVAQVITTIAAVGAGATAAGVEVTGLRAALLGLGAPEVLAAIAAAAVAYKTFKGDKTAGDTVQPGNPYVQGSESYYAYAAGAAGTKSKNGRVTLPGGGTESAANPAYLAGLKASASGKTPTGSQNSSAASMSSGKQKMLDLAKSAIGTPYLWGGSAPGGFDCSGLVMWAFANGLNVDLPRTTYEQAKTGSLVGTNTLKGATAGDVIFTQYGEGGVAGPGHEGIYLGGGRVLSAPHTGAKVGITSLAGFTSGGSYSVRNLAPGIVSSAAATGGRTTGGAAGAAGSPFGTPPAFTAGTGGNILPQSIELLMAKNSALFGPNSAQEIAALRKATAWLKANIQTFTGEDAVSAWQELAALNQQIASAAKKTLTLPSLIPGGAAVLQRAAKAALSIPPAGASGTFAYGSPSAASRITSSTQVSSLLGLLNGPVGATHSPDATQQVAQAQATLDELRKKLDPEIAAIKKQLTSPWITAADQAALRAQLSQYSKTVTTAVGNLSSALSAERDQFQQAWVAAGEAAKQQLEAAAATWESPSQILLDQLTDAHNTQQLQTQLAQAQQDLADALIGTPDDSAIVGNIKAILGQASLANVVDQVQSGILGISPAGVNTNSLLAQLTAATSAAAVPDPARVAQAQQEVSDAQYSIQVAGLQKTAAAEVDAHNQQLQENENQITALEGQWESFFTYHGGNINAIPGAWAAMLAGLGINISAPAQSAQDLINAALAVPTDAVAAAAAGYPIINGSQWTPALETAADAIQVAQVKALKGAYGPGGPPQLHAAGGTFITQGRTWLTPHDVAGEAGPELVRITPAGQGLGDDTHVHIHGNIPDDWFSVEIQKPRNAAAASRALGGRASERLRSGRH